MGSAAGARTAEDREVVGSNPTPPISVLFICFSFLLQFKMEYDDKTRGIGIKCGIMIQKQDIEQLVDIKKQLYDFLEKLTSGKKEELLKFPPLVQGIYKNIFSQMNRMEDIKNCVNYISNEVIKKKIGILLFKDVIQSWFNSGKNTEYILKVKDESNKAAEKLEEIVTKENVGLKEGIKKIDFSKYQPEVKEAYDIIEKCSENVSDIKFYIERLFLSFKGK